MTTLEWIITALGGAIAAFCGVRWVLLSIELSTTEDKASIKLQMKNILIVLVISLIVGFGAPINMIVNYYFK
ncbi:hypothetical protein RBG61_06440 [Paludicola sp. MB14-C6]|uniref:hypothetical protein n=1 Tax=Paludihabitans sp. MB14-C6 TaxID=3070656 RepID=UPI0027DB6E07|nr:hypothetical protein [Paludicola sp. MB14-C6]WMJ24299.1 hypothetical protein RBG61_06440 [Paludicola sp. MB14-C6]